MFEFVRGEDSGKSFYWGALQQPYLLPRSLSWICLSHVCHYWRKCVLGMKRFWRFIHITGSNYQSAQEITTTFLERSKPLHVTFHHETNRLPSSALTRLLDGVYQTLVENRKRIAKFFLSRLFHRTAWMLLAFPTLSKLDSILTGRHNFMAILCHIKTRLEIWSKGLR